MAPLAPFTRAMQMPVWLGHGYALPEGVELRRSGDLAALHLIGTSKVIGVVPSRLEAKNLPALLARLEEQS